jgi:hypothetical protein
MKNPPDKGGFLKRKRRDLKRQDFVQEVLGARCCWTPERWLVELVLVRHQAHTLQHLIR